jgi:hypothetical protein
MSDTRSIKPRWGTSGFKVGLAWRAYIDARAPSRRTLHKRLLALRVAVWAKPMRWFGAACLWLQHVSHGIYPNSLKFIALLLSG